MAEEAGDVFGAQGVIEDGATHRLLQDAQQDEFLIDLRTEGWLRWLGGAEGPQRIGGWRSTYLDDGLGDEGVEVGHQFAVYVGHVEVLRHHGDEAHRPVTDPQVGVTQERSCSPTERNNYTH